MKMYKPKTVGARRFWAYDNCEAEKEYIMDHPEFYTFCWFRNYFNLKTDKLGWPIEHVGNRKYSLRHVIQLFRKWLFI